MKNILIPFKNSIQDEYALDLAAKIAKQANSYLYVLTFEESSSEEDEWEDESDEKSALIAVNTSKRKTQLLLSKIKGINPDFIKYISLQEFDAGEINSIISNLKIDLMVLGLHKKTSFNERVFGSLTEKLLRTVTCPIITVKEKFRKDAISAIVFASDFEEDIKLPFFKFLHIASVLKAKTHLLYVNTPEDFKSSAYIKKTMDWFSEDYKKDAFSLNTYDSHLVDEGIFDFADTLKADLIAMISHEKTRFTLMSSSLTEKMINASELPILTIGII